MNRKIYIFTLLALLFGACQDFETDIPSGDMGGLIVNLDIPEPIVAKTRAGISSELSSLCVLIFDNNGLYLSKHDGVFVSGTTMSANYKFNSIPTTKDKAKLILHFVANYDWATFSDAANVGKSEAEVMNKLTVSNGKVTYWQRVELADGLDGTKGTTITLKDNVSLLRNIAKITVENLTKENVERKYLTNVTFAVGDYIDRGTVAPYSTSLYKFIKGAITEASDGTIVPIAGEGDFLHAQNGLNGTPSDVKYVYERKNSTARNQTYIIIKAFFQHSLSETNTSAPSYYKIDLDNENATALLDIERNYHYTVRINDVAMSGYPTLKEAMDNPASNNINAAIQTAEYTSVSDGTNILQIEKAVFSFVTSQQHFQIKCSYFDGIASQIDNTKIAVTLEQNASMPVIRNGAFSYSNGVISATTADIPTNNDIYQATFTVSDGKYLSRKITIRLRKPMNFLNVSVTPNDGTDLTFCKVANLVNQPVTITFSFPPDIAPTIFPLPVYIYSKKLSPDPTKEGIQPLSIDPTPISSFRYIYMAPYLGNDANDVPIPHTIYLVSSTPSTNEELVLASEYFNDVPIRLRSENMPALNNVTLNPNPVLKRKDEPVVLNFNIPNVTDKTLPYRIRIHTDYLEYVSTTGLDCQWDEIMGVYYYTTNTAGNQSITFKTSQAESSEYVRIDGDRFAAITIKRTIKLGEFKNVTVNTSKSNAGSPVDITFSFDDAGCAYANDGVYVYFTSKYLTPAIGSGIEPTEKANEYRMKVTSANAQTAHFTLKQHVNEWEGETVTISSGDYFKPYSINYIIEGVYNFGSDIPGYLNRPVLYSRYSGTAISLKERSSGQSNELHFSVPAGSASEAKPLWIYLSCTNLLNLEPSPRIGMTEVYPAGGYITGKGFWFKITIPGNIIVSIQSTIDYDNDAIITMTSVSGPGVTTSNGKFEEVKNIENKDWIR